MKVNISVNITNGVNKMERITNKQLEYLVEQINDLTNNPTVPWQVKDGGGCTANIGNYHISGA